MRLEKIDFCYLRIVEFCFLVFGKIIDSFDLYILVFLKNERGMGCIWDVY